MLGFRLSLPDLALQPVRGSFTPTPTPPPSVLANVVLEGDSITYFNADANGYARKYASAAPAGKTVTVDAQNSRVVAINGVDGGGAPIFFTDGDGGNSLISHVTDDVVTAGAQVVVAMIGTNDMASARTAAQYEADLAVYWARVKAKGGKFAWSPPPPLSTTQASGSYANFTAQRTALLATCRDPAVWGQWADYFVPLGLHPDFAAADNSALFASDGTHPNQAGHDRFYQVIKPALDSLFDAARAASTTMYASAWPASETNLATSAQLTRRSIVSGLAHAGLALTGGNALSATGGAQLSLNGDAFSPSKTGWLYNGDVVDLRVTTSASSATAVTTNLQVGSETRTLSYTTVASVTPVSVVAGSFIDLNGSGVTSASVAFPAAGLGVIVVSGYAPATPAVSFDGVAASVQGGRFNGTSRYRGIWILTVPVADTAAHILAITSGSAQAAYVCTVQNADPAPAANSAPVLDNSNNPNWPVPVTVPASGVALAFMQLDGGASPPAATTTGAGNTEIVNAFGAVNVGERFGLVGAKRAASGTIAFNWNSYDEQLVAALVFKAAGT